MTNHPAQPAPPKVDAIGYARRSSHAQRDNTSLDDQLKRITAHAVANDLNLLALLWDDAESGSNLDRPSLWDSICMLKCMQCPPRTMPDRLTTNEDWLLPCLCGEMKGADALIVWDFKRFGRNSSETVFLCLNVLDALGKRLLIVDGEIRVDTGTPIGRFMLRLMASMAELDREERMSQFNRGKAYIKQNTPRHAEGGVPYGFITNKERKQGSTLAPHMDEKHPMGGEFVVLKYIWLLHLSGMGYRAVAMRLNAQGIPARHGGEWHKTQVGRITMMESGKHYPQVMQYYEDIQKEALEELERIRIEQDKGRKKRA